MKFSTFHDALEVSNNPMSNEDFEELNVDGLEKITDKLFISMNPVNKIKGVQNLNNAILLNYFFERPMIDL